MVVSMIAEWLKHSVSTNVVFYFMHDTTHMLNVFSSKRAKCSWSMLNEGFMLLYVPPKQSRIQIISAHEPSVWLSSVINHSVQALITYSVAQASHVVTLICIAMLGRRLILCSALAMVTRQVLTENIKHAKHILAWRDSSERLLERHVISAVINLANIAMKKQLLGLQCLQWNHPSAVLL